MIGMLLRLYRRFSRLVAVVLLCMGCATPVLAGERFVVKNIRLEGLQRISQGTVFNYLPIKVGEILDDDRAMTIMQALFKTGFFQDVQLGRDGDELVVVVKERPAIASISIKGNEKIDTENLTDGLKQVGLTEGKVFDRSLLDKVEQELQRQYFNEGNYGIRIHSEIKSLERNRVDIVIRIIEGKQATITQINIIGNSVYDNKTLLGQFQLSESTIWSAISGSRKYSKQKLVGDLESLRSYYMDRGFVNFNIESTQVAITPDKEHVFVTINIAEGEQFTFSKVSLRSDREVVPQSELEALVEIAPDEVFSRRKVTESAARISERLGVDGYAFANVNPIPDIDNEKKQVNLTFFVDPGRRVYIRRINISGNHKTQDEVIRREIRQMENAWIATPKVNRSKIRLQRLQYFEDINIQTPSVPGTTDLVDMDVSVKEGATGSLMAGVGYGDLGGFQVQASVTQNNLFGSGKRLSFEVNNNEINKIYSLSYTNPYYTLNGVSRSLSLFARSTDASQANLADYKTDEQGGNISYGFPVSEYNTARLGIGYKNTDLALFNSAPDEYFNQLETFGGTVDVTVTEPKDEGDETKITREGSLLTEAYELTSSWSYDSRNRSLFASQGVVHTLSLEAALPFGGLNYYKLGYRGEWYYPLTRRYTFALSGTLGYGKAYGESDELPFFERYFAGGTTSVRGFVGNTLGPRDAETGLKALGGDRKMVGSMELYFPFPGAEDSNSFRLSAFYDMGNVFLGEEQITADMLRRSYGIAATWITQVGILRFNWAWPVDRQPGDRTQVFQFTIGAPIF